MRKLIIALPLLLMGCGVQESLENSYERDAQSSAQRILRISSIICADGNQVRMAVYGLGGNATAFSGWTILNDDGTPKKCVKRPKAVQQYEEVPQ